MVYAYLIIAIVAEVFATSAMAKSDGFTRLWPSLISFVGYGLAFYLLSLVTRTVPVGIVYAVWSGHRHRPGRGSRMAVLSARGSTCLRPSAMGMIVAGVLIINLLSKSVSH